LLRVKIAVIARRFLPKQSTGFKEIASLRSARNDITNQLETSIMAFGALDSQIVGLQRIYAWMIWPEWTYV
jgi:hypothetical protein